jgi:uncharacterized protein DUF4190
MTDPLPVPPAPQAGRGALVTPSSTNSMAVVSLVAGIAGYVIPHPFIAGIVAIVTGHMARRQIRQTGEAGSGMALAGLILGYVHLALSILLVLLLIGVFVLGAHLLTSR